MNDDRVFSKCAWRLIPFMMLLQVVYVLDRVNVGFAALTMNKDLGFSPAIFGFGAGIFFIGYLLFAVPANLLLERFGARRWVAFLILLWGGLSAANAFVHDAGTFYGLRFLLGISEAGFIPGMVLYLTYWFPKSDRGRFTAAFIAASPISNIVGGPLSGILLGLNGVGGLHGWQWLFLLEGAPACLLAFVTLRVLPDGPRAAPWLSAEEKETVLRRIGAEENTARGGDHQALWPALRDPRLWLCGFVMLGTYTALFGYVLWLPQIVQGMGFSNRATGFVVAIPYVASTIAMIVWGRSSDRHKERIRHVAGALLFAAAGFIAASLAGANLLVLAALTVAAMGAFAMLGPFYSLLSSFLRGTAAAGGIAFVNAVGTGLGGFLGPSAIGLLKQGTGGYASGLAALGFALMLSAALVLALGRSMAPRTAISLSKT